jgi:hypothetical protein
MTKPIKPSEVLVLKKALLPPEVIEVFNELIAENFSGGSSEFTQKEACLRLATKLNISEADIYRLKFLDVEGIYRKEGWKVVYDKPGYNETYNATFTFSKK